MNKLADLSDARAEALEARFALRVTAHLHEGAAQLPHDISERLRVARLQALAGLRPAAVRAAEVTPVTEAAHATVSMATGAGAVQVVLTNSAPHKLDEDPLPWRWRLANVLPILVLALGLWGIQVWQKHAKVAATTAVDMALLTDELPPDAYADPGFSEFLRQPETATPSTDSESFDVDDLIQEALELAPREAL